MKKKYIIITISIAVLCSGAMALYYGLSYYTPSKEIPPRQIQQYNNDTIKIAFIGDSWAFFHKAHYCKLPSIISHNIKKTVVIMSDGGCGATSKFVYSRLNADGPIQHIIDKHPNYCIISAGINDSHIKLGAFNYTENMKHIINFLLYNEITPIIIEIPNYDINKIYNDLNTRKKLIRKISMLITNSKIDSRDDYRQALLMMIERTYKPNQILLLRHDQWKSDANNDIDSLYRDDKIHLNSKGYHVLDSILSEIIISDYISKNEVDICTLQK